MSALGNSRNRRQFTRPPNPAQAIKASYQAAMKLDTVGMAVIVQEDSGQETHTVLTSLPWTLAHGAWVVKVEGKSGGYDCARIRPVGQSAPRPMGTRMERGGA